MTPVPDIRILPFRGAVSEDGKITAQLTRTFNGNTSLTLGLEYMVSFDSQEELSDIYADAFSTLNNEMRVQVTRLAQNSQMGEQLPNGGVGLNDTLDEDGDVLIDVKTISIEVKGDKKLYKVKGGRFEKFGVRLWLDSHVVGDVLRDEIERANPDSDGNLKMVNVRASIKLHEGKPTKIVRLWRTE